MERFYTTAWTDCCNARDDRVGAGLLLANKISREKRKAVGLPLLVGGLLTTIPIVIYLFHDKKQREGDAARPQF